MAESRKHRQLLKRIALWTAGAVLLLSGYVGGAPISGPLCKRHLPAVVPIWEIAYSPLVYYFDHPELPGCVRYREYCEWCHRALGE